MSENYFYSVEQYTQAEIKIKNSLFICHLEYVETPEAAKAFISSISEKYKDATHNCWGYITGKKAELSHCSDNGEPAGTAGKPILNMLQRHNLTNIACVITRYYGGVKLGVRGLIEAYGESTELGIQRASLKKLVEMSYYLIETTYDFADSLKYQLKTMNAEITDTEYTAVVNLSVSIETIYAAELEIYLTEQASRSKLSFIPG